MEYFIADTYFGDKSIIQIENRPFRDVDEMDECLIANWNTLVNQEDTVFVLGDFIGSSKVSFDRIHYLIESLRGRKTFVYGDHDDRVFSCLRGNCSIEHSYYPVIIHDFWILSHEPVYMSSNMPYANIFGHVHNNPMYKTVSSHSFCVSVERINYAPISFEEIKRQMQEYTI